MTEPKGGAALPALPCTAHHVPCALLLTGAALHAALQLKHSALRAALSQFQAALVLHHVYENHAAAMTGSCILNTLQATFKHTTGRLFYLS